MTGWHREIKKALKYHWQPFIRPYRYILRDQRLFQRLDDTLKGLLAAQTPKVQRIAINCPRAGRTPSCTAKAIHRLLQNKRFDWQTLLTPLYRRASAVFVRQDRVLGIIDLTPIEKPYARKMEGLCRIMKNDGSGITKGYEAVTILLRRGGKFGLGYNKLFSHQAEAMSQNHEIDRAMSAVRRQLAASTRMIWVWDRGFDDRKNYARVAGERDEFVGRVYHNRRISVKGRSRGLLSWGWRLPVQNEFRVRLSFWGQRRWVRISLGWGAFEFEGQRLWLLRARVIWAEGIAVGKLEDSEWWLMTNIPIGNRATAQRVWGYYRKRWEIENFFKFLKEGLNWEQFQIIRLEEIRRLSALVLIAGMFIYKLSGAVTEEAIQLVLRLGGWTGRDKPGKAVLLRGVARYYCYRSVAHFLGQHGFT